MLLIKDLTQPIQTSKNTFKKPIYKTLPWLDSVNYKKINKFV